MLLCRYKKKHNQTYISAKQQLIIYLHTKSFAKFLVLFVVVLGSSESADVK